MIDAMLVGMAGFLISAVMTGIMRRYALVRQLMDIPNDRSSHSVSTPRGGGLAIVLAFVVVLLSLAVSGKLGSGFLLATVPAAGAVAAVGFWDDHGHVSARVRIVVHFAAIAWAIVLLGDKLTAPIPWGLFDAGWFTLMLVGVALVWFLNLFNFMDGIDGIAAVEAVFIAGSGAALTALAGLAGISLAFVALGSASLGFLLWNWPPAKIFMGDVGSGFLGAALGILSYSAVAEGGVTLWTWVILAAVFVTDATIALARRIIRGEQWYKPHRSHAYQRASRRWGHRVVTLTVAFINLVWLLPLACYVFLHPHKGIIIAAAAYMPLILLTLVIGAGRDDDHV